MLPPVEVCVSDRNGEVVDVRADALKRIGWGDNTIIVQGRL
jgi:hypothetical protein